MSRDAKVVLLLLNPHLAVKREALAGIEKEVAERRLGWELVFLQQMVRLRDWTTGSGVAGVIAWPEVPPQEESLLRCRRPTVWMGHVSEGLRPVVRFDNEVIGRMVAGHFLQRGLRHFGFYAERAEHNYSRARGAGFAARLGEAGFVPAVHASEPEWLHFSTFEHSAKDLVRWLRGLPKPAGVMADRDEAGMTLLLAARRARVRVPDEVAVVGVGGDEIFCSLTRPRMSSVRLPGAQAGRKAVGLMADLLETRRKGSVTFGTFELWQEASSDVFARHDEAVNRALAFIRDRACDGTTGTDEVSRAAGVSRRVLEKRFRLATDRTVYDEITRVRIERACRLLSESNLGLAEIAERCGYAEPQRLSEAFRRRLGCSPGAYRKSVADG